MATMPRMLGDREILVHSRLDGTLWYDWKSVKRAYGVRSEYGPAVDKLPLLRVDAKDRGAHGKQFGYNGAAADYFVTTEALCRRCCPGTTVRAGRRSLWPGGSALFRYTCVQHHHGGGSTPRCRFANKALLNWACA
jgi:hypothetical protein